MSSSYTPLTFEQAVELEQYALKPDELDVLREKVIAETDAEFKPYPKFKKIWPLVHPDVESGDIERFKEHLVSLRTAEIPKMTTEIGMLNAYLKNTSKYKFDYFCDYTIQPLQYEFYLLLRTGDIQTSREHKLTTLIACKQVDVKCVPQQSQATAKATSTRQWYAHTMKIKTEKGSGLDPWGNVIDHSALNCGVNSGINAGIQNGLGYIQAKTKRLKLERDVKKEGVMTHPASYPHGSYFSDTSIPYSHRYCSSGTSIPYTHRYCSSGTSIPYSHGYRSPSTSIPYSQGYCYPSTSIPHSFDFLGKPTNRRVERQSPVMLQRPTHGVTNISESSSTQPFSFNPLFYS